MIINAIDSIAFNRRRFFFTIHNRKTNNKLIRTSSLQTIVFNQDIREHFEIKHERDGVGFQVLLSIPYPFV